MIRLFDELLGMQGAAQEGKIRGDGKLDIRAHTRHSKHTHRHAEERSRKRAVQEPLRLRGRTIEAGAEQPETQAGLVLDAEIIARRAALLAPPRSFAPLR